MTRTLDNSDKLQKFLQRLKNVGVQNPMEYGKWKLNRSRWSPVQKKPWSSSQKPPRLLPSGIDLSNLTPIFEKSLSSKGRITLPRKPMPGPLPRRGKIVIKENMTGEVKFFAQLKGEKNKRINNHSNCKANFYIFFLIVRKYNK